MLFLQLYSLQPFTSMLCLCWGLNLCYGPPSMRVLTGFRAEKEDPISQKSWTNSVWDLYIFCHFYNRVWKIMALMLAIHRHLYNIQTDIPQEMCEEQTSFSCSLWICYSVFWVVGACNSPNQPNAVKRKKLAVDSVFNKFDDEDSDDVPRKRKLVPLDYGEEDKSSIKGSVNTEEKRKHIKSLIEKIPTAKPELFAYPLDWSIVDSVSWFLLTSHKKA